MFGLLAASERLVQQRTARITKYFFISGTCMEKSSHAQSMRGLKSDQPLQGKGILKKNYRRRTMATANRGSPRAVRRQMAQGYSRPKLPKVREPAGAPNNYYFQNSFYNDSLFPMSSLPSCSTRRQFLMLIGCARGAASGSTAIVLFLIWTSRQFVNRRPELRLS